MSSYLEQIVSVAGYKANGLTALLTYYVREVSEHPSDVITASLIALNSSGTPIGSATEATVSGPTNTWKRVQLSKVLPAGTASVKVGFTFGVQTTPLIMLAHPRLQVGQMTAELITNGFFTDGTPFTGWTTVSGAFRDDTGSDFATDASALRCARPDGGSGASYAMSEIKQEIAIAAGYEYGAAELRFARGTGSLVGSGPSTGEVVLEALNGGGAVLGSVTTGEESPTLWTTRMLRLEIPAGAVTLRVRLRGAGDYLGPGEGGTYGAGAARFDDIQLRIHKQLDAAWERVFDFTSPPRCHMPTVWQGFYIAHPNLDWPMLWNGSALLPSSPPSLFDASATAAWSDGLAHSTVKFPGHWVIVGTNASSCNAYRFSRALAGVAVDLQTTSEEYGAFAKAGDFSVAVCFRTTEDVMTLACGLVGRRDNSGKGWGMTIDSSGRIVATVQGTIARTVTGTRDHRDKAAHWVLMTWTASTNTLKVYDDLGIATLSADPGEFAVTGIPMRFGRDSVSSATGGLDIARVMIWDSAIDPTVFGTQVDKIGVDPNGYINRSTGWMSSHEVWVDGENDATGATLIRSSKYHIPIGYIVPIGDGYGLSVGPSHVNLCRSTNFAAGVNCGPTANATVVSTSIEDPTGLAKGVRVTTTQPDYGYRLTDMPVSGTLPVRIVFWAKSFDSQSHDCGIRLINSSEVIVGSDEFTANATWTRFEFSFPWDGSTPTCHFEFVIFNESNKGFDLAHVVWVGQRGGAVSTQSIYNGVATAYTDAAVTIGDFGRGATALFAFPLQLNYEGELYCDVHCTETDQATGSGAHLLALANGVNFQNRRALLVNFSADNTQIVKENLWDGAAGSVSGPNGTTNLRGQWPVVLRARWNSVELPEALTKTADVTIDDATSPVEATAAPVLAPSATLHTELRIGGNAGTGETPPHAWIRKVAVRTREEKLA